MADRYTAPDQLSYADRKRIDEICDQFEHEWQADQQPDVRNFAAKLPKHLLLPGTLELILLNAFYQSANAPSASTNKIVAEVTRGGTYDASAKIRSDQWQHYLDLFPFLEGTEVPDEFKPIENDALIGGRFQPVRKHASGGLGSVSIASDLQFNRNVAIKEINSAFALNRRYQQRFIREAEISGQLEHPGVVPVYVLGRHENGEPYYAMRFVQGKSMLKAVREMHKQRDRASRSRQRRQLLSRFIDVCNTTEYAHSKEIIHRDIKPDNIMLGEFGETILVDWGLAKKLSEQDEPAIEPVGNQRHSKTQSGTILGTPGYMSPEQAAGRLDLVNTLSDVYGLGATMFHILTGSPVSPVARDDVDLPDTNRMRKRLENSDVPGPLTAICCKALSFEPAERYSSAQDLAGDIELALADEPIAVFKDPAHTRIRRWIQQHPAIAAAASATVCLLFFGLLGFSWLAAAHAREVQSKNRQLDQLVKQEKQLRVEAQQSEKRSSHAMDFLVDTLRSPDPELKGRDVRVVDLLENSIQNLDQDFGDDPLMKARVLSALGQTFSQLGDYEQAAVLLEQARSIYTANVGAFHRLTLDAEDRLGAAWLKLGDDRAGKLVEDVFQRSRKVFGADDPDTLRHEISLANVAVEKGDPERAVVILDRILPIYKKIHGPDSSKVFTLMNELAVAYAVDGQNVNAIELLKSVYEQRLEKRGPQSLKTLVNGGNYARLLHRSNRRGEAIPLYETLLFNARKSLGNDHYQTLLLIRELGKCYLDEADLEQGIALIEEAYTRTSQLYGKQHRLSLTAANSLGFAYMAKGDYEKTSEQFQSAYELYSTLLGPGHPETLTVANNLAAAYRLNQQFELAVDLFEKTLPAQADRIGKGNPKTIRTMVNYAAALQSASRYRESIPICYEAAEWAARINKDHVHVQTAMSLEGTAHLQEKNFELARSVIERCHDSRIRTMGDHWLRYHTMSMLGEALTGLKNFEDAEPLLLESYKKLVELESRIPARAKFRIGDAKERIAKFYDSQDLPDLAAKYRQ